MLKRERERLANKAASAAVLGIGWEAAFDSLKALEEEIPHAIWDESKRS